MGGDFCFQQFAIRQERTAMKVGTDGVLLGAWAAGGDRILDIGTGTGLVALMMAQRFPQARVVAIELEPEAARQAAENVAESPFAERVEIIEGDARALAKNSDLSDKSDWSDKSDKSDLADLANLAEKQRFSAIVCNPPFYEHTLPSRSAERDTARSTETLSFADLMATASRLLDSDGTLSIVAPADALDRLEAEAALRGQYIKERVRVKTVERKAPKRVLLSFSPTRPTALRDETVVLQDSDGKRSAWYQQLTADFYIK